MEEQNPVYLMLNYSESSESKKSILSFEMALLNLIKIRRRYNSLRTDELRLKYEMHKILKVINSKMKKTKATFPFVNLPEKAQAEEITKKDEEITKREKNIKKNLDADLESQLMEIQRKLKEMQS